MSEHDTFDLDRAFESLSNDISGASRAPGARNAIARSRRRRTTLASVAGVAVVAVAAAALQVPTSDRSAGPATGVDEPLPAAHVFDAAALTTATEGWTSAWKVPTTESTNALGTIQEASCLNQLDDSKAPNPPKDSGDLYWVDADHGVTVGDLADFTGMPTGVDQTWNLLTGGVDHCATATPAGRLSWQGGEARSYAVTAKGESGYLWLARQGDTVGLLLMGPVPQLPYATNVKVMTSLVAGLQDDTSFSTAANGGGTSGSSASAGPPVAMGSVSDADVAQALGSWQSGWRRDSGPKVDTSSLPCLHPGGSSSGRGTSLGGNGSMEVDTFDSTASATAAYHGIADQLNACSSAAWSTREIVRPGSTSVTVASTSDQGGAVAWLAQSGASIGYITIGGAGVSIQPPDSVSGAVGDAILTALKPVS